MNNETDSLAVQVQVVSAFRLSAHNRFNQTISSCISAKAD